MNDQLEKIKAKIDATYDEIVDLLCEAAAIVEADPRHVASWREYLNKDYPCDGDFWAEGLGYPYNCHIGFRVGGPRWDIESFGNFLSRNHIKILNLWFCRCTPLSPMECETALTKLRKVMAQIAKDRKEWPEDELTEREEAEQLMRLECEAALAAAVEKQEALALVVYDKEDPALVFFQEGKPATERRLVNVNTLENTQWLNAATTATAVPTATTGATNHGLS